MEKENKLDVRKAFEALAYILGQRHNVKITVVDVEKKDETKESA